MKRWLATGVVLVLLVFGAGAVGLLHVRDFLRTPLTVDANGALFEVRSGASFAEISELLGSRGITSNSTLLRWYARWTNEASKVQAGEYLIKPGTTPVALLHQFTTGAVQLYSFTLIEGWNHRELLHALQQHPEVAGTMEDADWPDLLSELGAATDAPEGLFLPETYRFPRATTDRKVLAQAYSLMQSVLNEEWSARAKDAPVNSPYEALILASIIEKETGRADERQRISGVFARRLAKNMRLQTDPTVIYGIGATFDGNLTRNDLRTDTVYNTYTRGGLPPTPIAMPGRASIHAALHPAPGNELYFVATGLGDGSHYFSVTHEEHEKAVQRYLRQLRNTSNRSQE
ncbi:MAG TPA: endolytic transglycosylase MltG [Woeseiaceae bacterium]|nr:endolytic transglycosylase MltG [Woeseiaceae bacterium]